MVGLSPSLGSAPASPAPCFQPAGRGVFSAKEIVHFSSSALSNACHTLGMLADAAAADPAGWPALAPLPQEMFLAADAGA